MSTAPLRVAFVLWSGTIGGAETFTTSLVDAMRARGADARLYFILGAGGLRSHLDQTGIPYHELGLERGRQVLRERKRLARMVSSAGSDVAILSSSGYLAAALRAGGFARPIIAIEHGSLLQIKNLGSYRRIVSRVDRVAGIKACAAVVPVSHYIEDRLDFAALRRHMRICCIPNGVDLDRYVPATDSPVRTGGSMTVACAARLVRGKGIEDVIEALTYDGLENVRMRVAGDGPCLNALKGIARSRAITERVEFLGRAEDMPEFWRAADVGVVPSNGLVESFGMSAVEAMACGKPVIVTDSGALPELVVAGQTGKVVPAGDVAGLARALREYAANPAMRQDHGRNGRRRCQEEFGIGRAAQRYLELCADVLRGPGDTSPVVRTPQYQGR